MAQVKNGETALRDIEDTEAKLEAILEHISSYIKRQLDSGKLDKDYIYPRNQLY